jgi:hypothetical protein
MTNGDLEQMDGAYAGVIADVVLEEMRNKYTAKYEKNPVIVFEDGWRIVLNKGMRKDLLHSLGSESDNWIGASIRIFLRPMTRKVGSGDGKQRLEKAAECLKPAAAEPETAERKELTADEVKWGG